MNVEQKRTACARLGLQAWTIGDKLFVDGKLPTEKAMADEWARHEAEVLINEAKGNRDIMVEFDEMKSLLITKNIIG